MKEVLGSNTFRVLQPPASARALACALYKKLSTSNRPIKNKTGSSIEKPVLFFECSSTLPFVPSTGQISNLFIEDLKILAALFDKLQSTIPIDY
jgi:hypothetical protein